MVRLSVVRRMDDLGRIVIPKEIRKKLELDEEGGDPMEMFLKSDNSLVLKKYNPTIEEKDTTCPDCKTALEWADTFRTSGRN